MHEPGSEHDKSTMVSPERQLSAHISPDLREIDDAELERKQSEIFEATKERTEKTKQRKEETVRRGEQAKKVLAEKLREEMELADALETSVHYGAESLLKEEESSSEEEALPEFIMGKRVKLRDPARGKMRRQKINLNSGYDMSKVAKHVEKDMEWQEPDNSDDEPEEKPPLTFTMKLSMDFEELSSDDTRAQFEDEVLADIADAAGVPRELFRVAALREGSVLVDIELARNIEALGEHKHAADAVVLDLIAQLKNPDSKLYKGKHTHLAVGVSSAQKLVDPAKAKPQAEPQKIPLWRTVVVYVCSSLEEERGRGGLEDERAVLYRHLFPRLKTKYAQRMVHLVFVDARLSYTAEPRSGTNLSLYASIMLSKPLTTPATPPGPAQVLSLLASLARQHEY